MTLEKFHEASGNTDLPMFNHWDVPPTQRDIERIITTEHRPISTLSSSSNIEFKFRTAQNEYIQLHKTNLYIRANIKLKAKTGEVTHTDWENVIPAQLLMHSMFKNVELLIGGKETCSKPPTYAQRAHFESKFGKTNDAKAAHMSAAGWGRSVDERLKMIKPETAKSSDIHTGKDFELMGPLHLDLALQPKAIIGGCDIRIILTPHDPSFFVQFKTGANLESAEINFLDASLYVSTALVHHDFMEFHNDGLKKSPAKYPMASAEVRHDTIPMGTHDISFDNVCNGVLPKLLIAQLIESDANNGSYSKDPYEYNHHDLNYVTAYFNGHQVPLNAYQMDYDKGLFIRPYLSLAQATNQDGMDSIVNISRYNYTKGNVHYAFNFAQDGSTGVASSVNPQMKGNLRIVFRFKKEVPKALTALFYCSYDKCLEIDVDRTPL